MVFLPDKPFNDLPLLPPEGEIETKAQFLMDAGIAKRQAAGDYLKKLDEIGVLRAQKVGKEKLYLNTKLFEVFSK